MFQAGVYAGDAVVTGTVETLFMSAVLKSNQSFDLRSERTGDTVRLHLSGEIDMVTATVLEEWLSKVECDPDCGILVDLEKVTFMDSSGVHALLGAADRASESGSQFA
ncbi:MAG TPA: STAS domain-containing protein, partial [Actinomycetota bacterium]|nr:STAS domain-containing protein [Actinomycetota bacterium]